MREFWLDRPVLVTGATGLVGAWLVKQLVEESSDVVCLVRDWVPQSELVRTRLVDKVKLVRGDVQDQSLLERVLGEYEIDTVFHLAAQTIVTIANRNPVSTFETNIAGTWALMEACRRSPSIRQVVFASSDKAYGDAQNLPYQEDMPLKGSHPYDVSKACADLIASSYARSFGLPVVTTRCGNFYGGGDLNWSRVIPGTIRSILRRTRPIIRSDGQAVRDYFYVEDAVGAYMLLAERVAEEPDLRGEAFNFSTEQRLSVLELVNQLSRLMNSTLEPDVRNVATNEIAQQYLSAEKARRLLGWKPLFGLETGLSKTVEWYQEFFGRVA